MGLKYQGSLGSSERKILGAPIHELVQEVQQGSLRPSELLQTYGKVAIHAHNKTNCLTEVMIKEAGEWLDNGSINLKGPLAGIPVSLKDTIGVGGFDATVGYSSFVGNKNRAWQKDGPLVQLLKDAGAVPYVKTNIPITLLSFESNNDVWGRCTNPTNPEYTAGGSTGGEAALLALGGRIGIGSDVAGSVRVPAHFSGIYSLRCSTGRWPKTGTSTSMPGQEGIPSVYSPMARTLDDLTYFTRSMVGMKPWTYDYSVHPLEWRHSIENQYRNQKLRVGIMRTDGVVDPSPACTRALRQVEDALLLAGHQIVEIEPPSPYEGLVLASQLISGDGMRTYKSFFRAGEWEDTGAHQMSWYMGLPRWVKYIYFWVTKHIHQDIMWAGLLQKWYPKSVYDHSKDVARREAYRAQWFEWWNEAELDCLLTPPNATPAVPHDAMRDAVSSCGYTFLFNLVSGSDSVVSHCFRPVELTKLT